MYEYKMKLSVVVPGLNQSKDLQIASLETVVATRGYLLTGNEDFIDHYQTYYDETRMRLDRSTEYAFTEDEQTATIEEVAASATNLAVMAENLINAIGIFEY